MSLFKCAVFRGRAFLLLAGVGLCFLFSGCKAGVRQPAAANKGSSSTAASTIASSGKSVRISWAPNREAAVNKAGGGYKVYYSQNAAFNPAKVLDVPFASGAFAPTTALISGLSSGTWNFRVAAYSAINTSGSSPSSTITVQVP